MKLKITDEKLNKFIQGYLDRGTKFTYKEVSEMIEIYYQSTVDKLMSIIEMQQAALETASNYMNNQGQDSTYIEIVIIETDKMLKELKGAG